MELIMNKTWNMPNSNTFDIKSIKALINKYTEKVQNDFGKENIVSVDPFANKNNLANITNDLDPQYNTTCHMDALDFLKFIENRSVHLLLFDPPYSPRQVSECYKRMGKTVNRETTQSNYWTKLKKEISNLIIPGGYVITCAWNSGGIGKKLGFEQKEILLVSHGGWHNDTIITVEQKVGE